MTSHTNFTTIISDYRDFIMLKMLTKLLYPRGIRGDGIIFKHLSHYCYYRKPSSKTLPKSTTQHTRVVNPSVVPHLLPPGDARPGNTVRHRAVKGAWCAQREEEQLSSLLKHGENTAPSWGMLQNGDRILAAWGDRARDRPGVGPGKIVSCGFRLSRALGSWVDSYLGEYPCT